MISAALLMNTASPRRRGTTLSSSFSASDWRPTRRRPRASEMIMSFSPLLGSSPAGQSGMASSLMNGNSFAVPSCSTAVKKLFMLRSMIGGDACCDRLVSHAVLAASQLPSWYCAMPISPRISESVGSSSNIAAYICTASEMLPDLWRLRALSRMFARSGLDNFIAFRSPKILGKQPLKELHVHEALEQAIHEDKTEDTGNESRS